MNLPFHLLLSPPCTIQSLSSHQLVISHFSATSIKIDNISWRNVFGIARVGLAVTEKSLVLSKLQFGFGRKTVVVLFITKIASSPSVHQVKYSSPSMSWQRATRYAKNHAGCGRVGVGMASGRRLSHGQIQEIYPMGAKLDIGIRGS